MCIRTCVYIYIYIYIYIYVYTYIDVYIGAFGTVHRAALKAPSREAVAVKVLDKRQMRRQRVTKKLVLEEVALMKLCRGQERFVQIHDFLEGRSAYYIVMELCTGGNLEQAVHSWWEREPLGEPHVAPCHMLLYMLYYIIACIVTYDMMIYEYMMRYDYR